MLLFHFLSFFPLLLHPHIDHGVDRRTLPPRHRGQLVRQDAELVEGVVRVIRFAIALLDQFFTCSTSSFTS